MTIDTGFTPVSSFDDVHKNIMMLTEEPVYNLVYKFKIPVSSLSHFQFVDRYNDAELWQSENCPDCLYFSHKQYFGQQGIAHVKDELVRKPNSKRAIISLLSQDKINGSGDNPIPSFMLAQYALSGNILYATFYYRALETSDFLKINLEEFRMMADEIKPPTVTEVCGTLISFYAYQDVGFTNLKKNRLDYIEYNDLYYVLKDSKSDLCALLMELKRPSSVISSKGVLKIKKWLETTKFHKEVEGKAIGTPLFLQQISKLTVEIDKLSNLLSRGATVSQIDDARKTIGGLVDNLINKISEE